MRLTPIFAILCATSLLCHGVRANDGAFRARGNQLIPVTENDISLKKEILTLKKVRNQFIEVTVYYEFFNPVKEKTITVGFEAFSPSGDVDGTPVNGLHPYMRDFTVDLNDSILGYQVAYVHDSLYVKNGRIISSKVPDRDQIANVNAVDFYYVYHFKARFKSGLNIIKHTYNYDLSGSVIFNYYFQYVLTSASRWSNRQIDDFTLILDMGEFETFHIDKTFFNHEREWLINGIGKANSKLDMRDSFYGHRSLMFHLQKGTLIFQKKNFRITGDLFLYTWLYALNYRQANTLEYIPFSYYQQEYIGEPKTELQRKVLRNLPFARRGCIFKNQELNNFYRKMDWYIPNPNYVPDTTIITETERKWLKRWN